MKTKLCVGVLGVASLLAGSANATTDNDAIRERLKLIGNVCVEGDAACSAPSPASVASNASSSPESVYSKSCAACHDTGAAGAPAKGDKAAWAPRVAQGMDTLFKHAWNGLNGMPAKGLCLTCSEDELKAVIKYMVDASK